MSRLTKEYVLMVLKSEYEGGTENGWTMPYAGGRRKKFASAEKYMLDFIEEDFHPEDQEFVKEILYKEILMKQ